MDEFNRLEQYSKAFKPPEVKYKDLEAIVTARIVRDQMKFNWGTDYVKVTNDTVLVPITVQVPNNQLSVQLERRRLLRDAQRFWPRQLADRPRRADV